MPHAIGDLIVTPKKGIFISHIHEEAKLGAVVKEWVGDAFRGSGVNAFLSSDKGDLPAGRKWLDVIEKQIDEAGVMISLISPTSLARAWVNIELGAAWIKHVPVIPFCHSQQKVATLPKPFGDFNAITLDSADAAKDLLGGIADALQIAHPQRYPFADFLKEMRAAATTSEALQVVSAALGSMPTNDLPAEQIAILQALAAFGNQHGEEYVRGPDAPRMCGLKPMIFKHHAEKLVEADLINVSYWSDEGDGSHYQITGEGAGWLLERGLMPG
jgi:TIR domain